MCLLLYTFFVFLFYFGFYYSFQRIRLPFAPKKRKTSDCGRRCCNIAYTIRRVQTFIGVNFICRLGSMAVWSRYMRRKYSRVWHHNVPVFSSRYETKLYPCAPNCVLFFRVAVFNRTRTLRPLLQSALCKAYEIG